VAIEVTLVQPALLCTVLYLTMSRLLDISKKVLYFCASASCLCCARV